MSGTFVTPQPRPELMELPAYRAGKPAAVVPGLTPLKLSSNERSEGPSAAVRARLLEEFAFNRYPDPMNTELCVALAARLGVSAEQIVTESGSLGALRLLLDVLIPRSGGGEAPAEIVYPWRSFEAYPILASVAGATGIPVPLAVDGTNDLEAMADAITPHTRAVFVCTPNNPTGPIITREQFADFMRRVPANVLVIVDEAYTEYVDDPEALDGIVAFSEHSNIAVLRTFSKAHGLAGLRVGYAVVSRELADAMWRIRPTFAVTALAERAAVLALADTEGLAAHVAEVQHGRRAIINALRDVGEHPLESQSNFVWFVPRDPDSFEACAARAAISVRRLDGGIRITVGDAAATERVLALIADAEH
ncbi:aminotransferase class I/II-fold pyridoxal phosphate-dependent enzyme [Leucobacter insecticola]|uniref:Aminotransferase class I/II-fold pyridoxal phosphate-dependent enzyme n=1 Tax=Leucobacter insecticola TaxID=2714934 RepID=A0A6G8FIN7_9MICO|nr:aminotransferase class I/II-fold pyridoxal phosphate-dependent enzyme [Leucobacter insecticola]QIM16163.1 aminotransferase class I/II-fold pyridoxal phosphate-dependent enzyme [Leucobacter insecticola]